MKNLNAGSIVDRLLEEDQNRHPSYYDPKKAIPILPIGLVNLTTGKNGLFGNVFDGWAEGDGINLLVKDGSPEVGLVGKVMAVHSSGDVGLREGTWVRFRHDQTRRPIGGEWEVVGIFPHTKEGLAQMSQKAGKSSVSMATFK